MDFKLLALISVAGICRIAFLCGLAAGVGYALGFSAPGVGITDADPVAVAVTVAKIASPFAFLVTVFHYCHIYALAASKGA